ADGAAAIAITDDLTHQHGAGGPLSAEAKTLQGAEDEQLGEILGEAAQAGEHSVPDNGDLQHAHPPIAVRQSAGEPTAKGGDQQRNGTQDPGLAGGDVPEREQAWNDEGENLHIK